MESDPIEGITGQQPSTSAATISPTSRQLGDHDEVLFGSISSTKCKSICQVVQGDKVCITEIIWKASDKPQSTSEGCAPCSIQQGECTLFQGCDYSKDMIILKMWLYIPRMWLQLQGSIFTAVPDQSTTQPKMWYSADCSAATMWKNVSVPLL